MKTNQKTSKLLRTKKVRIQKFGINIRYAEQGNASRPKILLLHGVPENLQSWCDIVPSLSEDYHVLPLTGQASEVVRP